MSELKYRPEIDGLRAVAVLAVILFHAGVPHMGGGYVGVDVFFVISGYLITSLFLKNREQGQFQFARFWERRARRILPAQLTVMVATLATCSVFYFPDDRTLVAKQALSQLFMASNVFFYQASADYFGPSQILKPLLHLWSLALEEQFYILFPPLMWLLWKMGKVPPWLTLSILMFLSFAASLWMMDRNTNAAFYLLPFRAWELLLGALIAAYPKPLLEKRLDREFAGVAGLLLILAPIFCYTPQTPFPGIAALIPCLGAALFIMSNSGERNAVGRLLVWWPFVFIGLISYSLYLWHWPFLIIYQYLNPAGVTGMEKTALMLAVLLLSALSWRFIEQPFRRRRGGKAARRFTVSIALLLVILAAGFAAYFYQNHKQAELLAFASHTGGVPYEKNPYSRQCDIDDKKPFAGKLVCETNPGSGIAPSFAVWGDSYADAITPAFFELSKENNRNGYIFSGPVARRFSIAI